MLFKQIGSAVEIFGALQSAELIPLDLRGVRSAHHAVDIGFVRPNRLADFDRRIEWREDRDFLAAATAGGCRGPSL